MTKRCSRHIVILTIVAILIGGSSLSAFFAGNESECAFGEVCGTSGLVGRSAALGSELGVLVVEGGSYFLYTLGDIHRFLAQVESTETYGVDFDLLRQTLSAAVNNIKNAQTAYRQLSEQADGTPYNMIIIDRLTSFNYKKFQHAAGLMPSVFDDVTAYLSTGDVRGIYKQFLTNSNSLLKELLILKSSLDAGIMPDLSRQWRLNQMCAQYKLFGQYVAQVFYAIK